MPPKKTAAELRKALTRAENEEKRDQLELALQKAQEIKGCGEHPNLSELADEFNVPRSTLGHHLNGRMSKREAGIKCRLLPLEAEYALVSFLEEAARRGFPETKETAKAYALAILRNLNGDPTAGIGQKWMDRFLERHAERLKSVWGSSQTMLRGGAVNPETVDHWFSLLSQTIAKFSIVPELLFAMDETCCFIDKSTKRFKVIGHSKQHAQIALKDENRETITLIPLISAAGHLYPPTVIFKGKQIKNKAELPNPLGAS
jgi:hypothetical protein